MLTFMTEPFALIDVRPVGRVEAIDRLPGLRVVDPSGAEFSPSREWLKSLLANDFSPHTTLRAYAMSLLRFLRFAWTIDCPWDRVTEGEVTEFVLWARQAPKFVGNRQSAQVKTGINLTTGKRYQGGRYSPKTINHTLSVVHEFYGYHLDRGAGPIVNPVPAGRSRAAGDDVGRRRARLRQREQNRTPRMIPDAQFNELFRRLPSNRDRALVAFYVSSGVRASELLGLTGDMVNLGDQLIGVVRKGGALQWVPASPDAFVWLRLYQFERGVAAAGQPVWLTLRHPQRPMTYDALRAVLARINQLLGSNWTTHDLRHTFAQRALDGGMALHEVQEILGHASLATTSVYTTPHLDDVIAHHRAALSRRHQPKDQLLSEAYDQTELQSLFERVLP